MRCTYWYENAWHEGVAFLHSQFLGRTYYTVRDGSILLTLPASKVKF